MAVGMDERRVEYLQLVTGVTGAQNHEMGCTHANI